MQNGLLFVVFPQRLKELVKASVVFGLKKITIHIEGAFEPQLISLFFRGELIRGKTIFYAARWRKIFPPKAGRRFNSEIVQFLVAIMEIDHLLPVLTLKCRL